jgi:hypothetical protein
MNTFGESKTVDIQEKDGGLLIRPLTKDIALVNWEVQFSVAIANGYIPEIETNQIENEFDDEDWTW